MQSTFKIQNNEIATKKTKPIKKKAITYLTSNK